MTKSTWIETEDGPVHFDVANEATKEDMAKMVKYIEELQVEQKQRKKDFESLWQTYGVALAPKDLAEWWFTAGYDLAEMRLGHKMKQAKEQ